MSHVGSHLSVLCLSWEILLIKERPSLPGAWSLSHPLLWKLELEETDGSVQRFEGLASAPHVDVQELGAVLGGQL